MSRSDVNKRDGSVENKDGRPKQGVLLSLVHGSKVHVQPGPSVIEVSGLKMDNDDSSMQVNSIEVVSESRPDMGGTQSASQTQNSQVEESHMQPLTTTTEFHIDAESSLTEKKSSTHSCVKKPSDGNANDEINTITTANDSTDERDDKLKRVDYITVAGKDDVDAASTYSLFMEKDFRYYFQHPYSRLTIAYVVVFFNFLIYAEDPVAHSRKECSIPMLGNAIAFVFTRYPANAWSLLKVVFWLIGLIVGLFVGKLLVHGLLFTRVLRLKMFRDDQGSWMIMFMISLVTVFIMSAIYTAFLSIGGDETLPYRISSLMGISNDIFMKIAACGTWCGDFFTAWMVTDIMLQEKLYPGWARGARTWWQRGYNRIILFWICVVITSFIVIFVIATDYIQWDKLNRDFVPSNEVARAFLASVILVMDLLIVMQDWDFPHFLSAIDVKLPGLNTAHIQFEIPKCLKKESWNVHITGKWFNYGILFIVMLLDLNMWKNQIFFLPYDYGQYTGPENRIYTVQDDETLDANETVLSYDYRNTVINPLTNQTYLSGDSVMNSRYLYSHLGIKGIAFIPSLVLFILFGVLIFMFGRFRPTSDDPYAGRLKKRAKKKRFSFRMPWRRREEVNRKIHAVPVLTQFMRKTEMGAPKPLVGDEEPDGVRKVEMTSPKSVVADDVSDEGGFTPKKEVDAIDEAKISTETESATVQS